MTFDDLSLEDLVNRKQTFAFSTEFAEITKNLKLGVWKVDESIGLYHSSLKIYACPIPVLPAALYRNDDTGQEKVQLKFFKFKKWHSITVERKQIASKSAIINLANDGIEVSEDNAHNLVKALNEIIAASLETIPTYRTKSCLGWHEGQFLPYSKEVIYDESKEYGDLYNAVSERGTLDEWCEYMKKLRKNKVFRLMLAASFASPLVEIVGQNPFILHLWGLTSIGKTVSLMAAMSIWGNPEVGRMVRTLNMTTNAMLQTAAFLKNLPFAADELETIKSSFVDYNQLIMQLTESVNRSRMKYEQLMPLGSWRNAFIFTGEEPILKQSSGGGAKNRVIQVECNEKIIENGNETANFVRTHYGCAGRKFIENLDKERAVNLYKDVYGDLINNFDVTDKQAGSAALLLVADWLSSELFFPDDTEVLQLDTVARYLSSQKEVDPAEQAYQLTLDLITEHNRNFTPDAIDCWGLISGGRCYFINSVLTRELDRLGFDLNAVKSAWAERGYLVKSDTGRYRYLKRICDATISCTCVVLPE